MWGTVKYTRGDKNSDSKKTEKRKCFNYGKEGHIKDDCWSKGGGHQGKGPTRRKKGGNQVNQTQESINISLNEVAYVSQESHNFSHYDWILDLATISLYYKRSIYQLHPTQKFTHL